MWLNKIKFKKAQFVLIAVLIAVISMIFAASVSYVFETNRFVKKFYSKESMPDILIAAYSPTYQKIETDSILTDKIESSTVYKGYASSGTIKLNEKAIGAQSFIFPLHDKSSLVFKMDLKDNTNLQAPKKGEIWIPYTYADLNKISIGDSFTVSDTGAFTVSAFYVTPMTATVYMPFTSYFISLEDFDDVSSNFELIFAQPKNGVNTDELLNMLMEKAGANLLNGFTRDAVATGDATATNIVGSISIVASLILFFAAILIIAYIIRNNILKEYRAIGIYKSMGFSYKKIKGIYIRGYLLICLIASIIGAFLSLPITRSIAKPATKYLGNFNLSFVSYIVGIVSVIFLTALIAFSLNFVLNRISKIKPTEALNIGLRSNVKKLKKSVIKNARSPLSVSVNEIFKYAGTSMLTTLLLATAFFLTYLFGGISNSMSYVDKKTAAYFYVPEGDAYVMIGAHDEKTIYNASKQSSYVNEAILVYTGFNKVEIENLQISMEIFKQSNFDSKLTGMPYVSGRGPKNSGEIALNVDLIKKLKVNINDYVKASFTDDNTKSYLVVGSFTAIGGAQYSAQVMDNVNLTGDSKYLSVKLKKKTDYEFFKTYIENNFDVFVTDSYPGLGLIASMVKDIVGPALNILMAIFIGFAAIVVINVLFQNYMDNKKSYASLKSMGFSTKYITLKNLCKTLILMFTASVLGLVLGIIINPFIYKFIVGNNAYVFSWGLTCGLVGVFTLLVVCITLLLIIPVRKIKAKDLMEE